MKDGIIPSHIIQGKLAVPNPEYATALYEVRSVDRHGNAIECYPVMRTNDPDFLVKMQQRLTEKRNKNHTTT